ncbi:MAG: hypothetical protein JNN20_14790 [Betaproteobacteria bacterium]|nr:hypothetical protein [Betaproteobacteria bacterium]
MPWYRAIIRGENVFLEMEGAVQRLGFYTNRFIEAATSDQAEHDAIAEIRAETKLRNGLRNLTNDPPMLFVDEIVEVASAEIPNVKQGLAFFKSENDG